MIVWPELHDASSSTRSHPWEHSGFEGGGSYQDFKTSPHLIPQVLEDFKLHESRKAVRTFYEFLTWLNGTDSKFESNDCAFREPDENADVGLSSKKLRCCGRVEILYRQLAANVHQQAVDWLIKSLFIELCKANPTFIDGFIEIGTRSTPYLELRDAGKRMKGSAYIYTSVHMVTMTMRLSRISTPYLKACFAP